MKRKGISLVLVIMLLSSVMAGFPTTVSATAIPDNASISRLAASEGIVLLENKGILPLGPAAKVAVFGPSRHMNGSTYPTDGFGKDGFITYGGGSGEVTAPYVVDLLAGLNNRKDEGKLQSVADGGVNPSAAAVDAAAQTHDVAVVVIRRWTAEASDLSAGAGGYLLSADETTMMQRVNDAFDHVVVVMNAGNAIDMTWVENYAHVSAVLAAWYPGMEGGNALADVLCGAVNPSGKLVDTFARSIGDYPSSATFAQSNPQYTDDIYVGYRYFATADPNYEKVKYEFGYGLSYSTFAITDKAVAVEGGELVATAKVTNNGPYPGKEVLQVYYAAPAGALNKPAFTLAAFAKTSLLEVGKSETVQMRFPIRSMASYDDVGKTGAISAYVLEAGDYDIYIGNSIKNATKSAAAGRYTQAALRVTEQLSKRLTPPTAFNRLVDPVSGTYQSTDWTPADGAPTPGAPNPDPGPAAPVARVPWTGGGTIALEDVYRQPGYLYDFVAQMTDAELRVMSRHQGSSILANGTGAIGKLAKYGIPEVNTADGPAGLRIGVIGSRTVQATSFPIGTLLACTWNEKLMEAVGAAVGAEMELNRVDIWLAPGLNIHRNPRNGRNFEYYSEDPLVAGKSAAAVTRGVQGRGGLVTIKHFAANNQETNRYNTNSQVSERALREIYLKGFEIAVKEADPGCVMTSYNYLNGTRTEASYDLLTNILRNEWGFKGLVMTDWWNGRA
ncbi:MAG: glycoside hydrolase family 3 C-terminal domain-containing protein, partial [Oscillospiraceae bacterium]|nr:glycoside hydrolase family 3 C-terminal domain-containing protein [Oscillospiraceae bacterium]